MGKTFYNLSCEELCDLMCGIPEDDYEEEDMGRGQSKASVSGGGMPTNYKGQTKEEWEKANKDIELEFAAWLDSKDKKAFEADEYNVYEKMSLDEVRKSLKPESEKGFSYNSDDFVPEDNWWYVEYSDGTSISLEPYDDLRKVKRNNIELAVNMNDSTTGIYSRKGSGYIEIMNDAKFEDNNDIWRWERYKYSPFK